MTAEAPAPVPVAPRQPQVIAPADDGPPAPKLRSNRIAGTAWVLLAALLFEVVYIALIAGFVLVVAGPNAVGQQLALFAPTPFAWLPVVFFFLLFELTVLLVNRAGRFTYVVASLIVSLLVYVISVLLITILVRGSIGDMPTLTQSFESPFFIFIGLVAREVMLWTGFAIGARGKRLRGRNREAQAQYEREQFARQAAGQGDAGAAV